ncbi:MAG TPA: flagellar protein FlgN [Acidimicrobiia bacterium]|nr:flagellar protein FlgN [Acidimicrobiia bacterium]
MALSDVSNILWRERQLLELLVFKLEEEQLVLAAGRTRWLAHATREVESVLGEIKRIELERAMQVAEAGRELGLSGAPTLRELAALTSAPWDGIFAEHRRALLALAQEIDAITKSNRELLQRGNQAARDALVAIGEIDIEAYDARGSLPDRSLALRIVDEAI